MPSFLCGLGQRDKTLNCIPQSASELERYQQPGCIFCNASSDTGFKVAYEDEELIAFQDRAEVHLLIIPRYHLVSTVRELDAGHIPLLSRMETLAYRLSPKQDPRLGFHIPPFSSVHHLHLHVLSGRLTTVGKLKYPTRTRGESDSKGWSWFVSLAQVKAILAGGGRVSLGSSTP